MTKDINRVMSSYREQIKELKAELAELKEENLHIKDISRTSYRLVSERNAEIQDLKDHIDLITAEDEQIEAVIRGKETEIERLKELVMKTHDTLLSVRGNCECDNAKIFKIRQEHEQALAAQPQKGQDNESE